MMGLNSIYLVNRFKLDKPMDFIFGDITRDEYIQTYRPEYAAYQYANAHLGYDSKILGVYLGNRGYYSDRHIEFSIELLKDFAKNAESGLYVAEKLYERGFTHLLVNFQLFNTWAQKYTDHEQQMMEHFF
nr:hypothetical protein [Desulfobacula sp.]